MKTTEQVQIRERKVRSVWPTTIRGWLILHPRVNKTQFARKYAGGPGPAPVPRTVPAYVETEHFQTRKWMDPKYGKISREKWRQIHRPDCIMVKGLLTLAPPKAKRGPRILSAPAAVSEAARSAAGHSASMAAPQPVARVKRAAYKEAAVA